MRWLRAGLAQWTVLAIALLAGPIAAPRAALYFHHHAGGDHFHVHPDGDAHDERQHHHHGVESGHSEHHHHQLAETPVAGPAFEAPDDDDDGMGHWHSQDVFQRAVAPAIKTVQPVEAIRVIPVGTDRLLAYRPALPVRARGPPSPA